jgi:hypothetical protein
MSRCDIVMSCLTAVVQMAEGSHRELPGIAIQGSTSLRCKAAFVPSGEHVQLISINDKVPVLGEVTHSLLNQHLLRSSHGFQGQ